MHLSPWKFFVKKFCWGELMFTTSCVFVSLFCCMLISNTSFYVQDNLVHPNWWQEVQNFVHMHASPCIFLRASSWIIHRPARPDQPVCSPQPVPPEPVLAARNGPSWADGLARARRITGHRQHRKHIPNSGFFKKSSSLIMDWFGKQSIFTMVSF